MLTLPDSGFQPSVNSHNVDLDALVDWVEGSVVFVDELLAQVDVVDSLCENGIYRDRESMTAQDFAVERVADAWVELERRSRSLLRGAPFRISGRRIFRTRAWETNPTYSFCLLLSLQVRFRRWARQFGSDFTEQGKLFERLTAECLETTGWTVYRTGWAPGNAAKIGQVVSAVSDHIRESARPGEIHKWMSEHANEEALDVVCSRPFVDGWGGRPLYFFQCASGANWDTKLTTPDVDVWGKIISFSNVPKRGFSMPFALLEDDFRRSAGRVNGILLDRFRLQSPSIEGDTDWVSDELSADILAWMKPRVEKLPDDRA